MVNTDIVKETPQTAPTSSFGLGEKCRGAQNGRAKWTRIIDARSPSVGGFQYDSIRDYWFIKTRTLLF